MTKRFRPLHELTLFAGEEDLAMAVLGPGQLRHWKQVVQLLEERGFPRSDALMGGRYTPAVKAFFDREYRVWGPEQVSAPHSPAKLGASHDRSAEKLGSWARKVAAAAGLEARHTDRPATSSPACHGALRCRPLPSMAICRPHDWGTDERASEIR